MTRKIHLVVFAALIALGSASLHAAAPGRIAGTVRDSAGVPQIGAQVQLLRSDLSVILSVYTDAKGRFVIPSVLPGRYAVKAMGDWFLPSLRENIQVRSRTTVVNLTLNTLYEVMQWLPAESRTRNARRDDWVWTLRSAANRPLLRWLEDGPLVVVSDGSAGHPRLKARLLATGQQGAFNESGARISAEVENTPSNSRELLAHVDFAPGSDADMESMLGFRQDLGFAGSVQSVAAIAIHPEAVTTDGQGLDEAALRSWESLHLGDEFQCEVGSNQVLARISGPSPNNVAAVLPFATLGWINGNNTFRYRMTTMMPAANRDEDTGDTQAQTWLPALSADNSGLAIEQGLHQELGWERRTNLSGFAFMLFSDRIDNPVLEAASHFAAGDSIPAGVLLDPVSNLIHTAGPGFSTAGVWASFEHGLIGGSSIRLSYASGDALVLSAPAAGVLPSSFIAELLSGTHPRRAQMYALSLSGTIDGTGTHWQASYRWQPADTVTEVAPFVVDADEPFLNLRFHQPIRVNGGNTEGLELLVDLQNLLAEGYVPYLSSDGSLLIFAQTQRGVRVGLGFNF
ncbi:MAG: carboxypeptidase-like regulatory domain-containing protein [Terracidiphilus sp.]